MTRLELAAAALFVVVMFVLYAAYLFSMPRPPPSDEATRKAAYLWCARALASARTDNVAQPVVVEIARIQQALLRAAETPEVSAPHTVPGLVGTNGAAH